MTGLEALHSEQVYECQSSLKRVALKFCGGCDCTYDRTSNGRGSRAEAVDKIQWVLLDDAHYDAVLMIHGCPVACPEKHLDPGPALACRGGDRLTGSAPERSSRNSFCEVRYERIVTKEDYIKSLKDLKVVIYYNGRKVEDGAHPGFLPHINSAAKTYEMALMPEYEDLLTATSHLTGKKISRFTHIHQSVDDLIKKVQMLRLIAHETASCFQRCVGFDGLNATYMTTYDIDEKYGTSYFKRFEEYLKIRSRRRTSWSWAA